MMKRRISVAILAALVALSIVSGVSAMALREGSRSPQLLITAVGTVSRAAEASLCMQGGTHNLEAATGIWSYQLKSSTINLSQYEGREVQVFGTVEETLEGCPSVMNVVRVERALLERKP
jgi:hypothetical protein